MPTYSDAEMRAIMGRALQIDSGRSDRFTPEQLRTVAAELGISTQALEVAMYEADSGASGLPAERLPVPALRSWRRIALGTVGLLMVAALGVFVLGRRIPARAPAPAAEAAPARAVQPVEVAPAAPRIAPTKTGTKKKIAPPQ